MRSSRNKNSNHEENDTHRWIISYADFITLLFAFFVVMYAISSVNQAKYNSLTEGLHSAFNKKDKNKAPVSNDTLKDGPSPAPYTVAKGTFGDGLDVLNSSLTEFASGDFKVNRRDGWIDMDITAGSLFKPGTAELMPNALVNILKLANKIKDVPFPVAIEGYTDNTPIDTPEYRSNWELSAARAAAIGRMLNAYGVSPERILIVGYGDQFPIMDNATEVGRSRNRRVNIVISKDRGVKRMLSPELIQRQEPVATTIMSAGSQR